MINKWDSNLWIVLDIVSYIKQYNTVIKNYQLDMQILECCIVMKYMVHLQDWQESVNSLKMMHTSFVLFNRFNKKLENVWISCIVFMENWDLLMN